MTTQLAVGLGSMGDLLEIITDDVPGKVALGATHSLATAFRELTTTLKESESRVVLEAPRAPCS